MIYVLAGTPGSGKTVIADHFADAFKVKHVSFRKLVHETLGKKSSKENKTKQDWLEFKPFEANSAFNILKKAILETKDNFVLEGYPKSAEEAELLVKLFDNNKLSATLFLIDTDWDKSKRELLQRLVCPECAYVCRNPNLNKVIPSQCPNCHMELIKRQDDDEEKIRFRFDRFNNEKKGIAEAFKKNHKVVKINGSQTLAEIISDVIEKLDKNTPKNLVEARRGARMLIEGLGLDLADPNLIGTPRRVTKTLLEITEGNDFAAQDEIRNLLSTAFPTVYKGMVILDPIVVHSLCSHHLLSVEYVVLFGYIPKKLSLGFSKIVKAIKLIAAKPTLQEDFTQEIIETFQRILDPKGVMVVVKGKHSCMSIRGEKSANVNITSALRGDFKTSQKTREEFLSLAKFSNH